MDCQSAPCFSFYHHFEQRTISGPRGELPCKEEEVKYEAWQCAHCHHLWHSWDSDYVWEPQPLCSAPRHVSCYLVPSQKDENGMEKSSSLWAWRGDILGKSVSFVTKVKKPVCSSRIIMSCPEGNELLFWVGNWHRPNDMEGSPCLTNLQCLAISLWIKYNSLKWPLDPLRSAPAYLIQSCLSQPPLFHLLPSSLIFSLLLPSVRALHVLDPLPGTLFHSLFVLTAPIPSLDHICITASQENPPCPLPGPGPPRGLFLAVCIHLSMWIFD